jgi:hypothetical protein
MTSAAAIPNASLNDDNTIPVLGIGVGELTEEQTEHAVSSALEIGIRLIDTAAAYGNEAAVGRAVNASGIPRAEGQPRPPRHGLRRRLSHPLARRGRRGQVRQQLGRHDEVQGGRPHQVDRRLQLHRR